MVKLAVVNQRKQDLIGCSCREHFPGHMVWHLWLSCLSICLSVGQHFPGASVVCGTLTNLPLGQKAAKFWGLTLSSYRGGPLDPYGTLKSKNSIFESCSWDFHAKPTVYCSNHSLRVYSLCWPWWRDPIVTHCVISPVLWLLLFPSFIFSLPFPLSYLNATTASLSLSEYLLAETYRAEWK